ncbi:MAG: hypothetical protein MI923_29135 [Phycisphaerales bacterium]|nr:hypothetical protein [Phycisphaerales bacterium]
MSNIRLPMAVCAVVAEILSKTGSHKTLDALFRAAGALGSPPDLSHGSKWKTWLFQEGNNEDVDSLALLGNLIEEFMDLPPLQHTADALNGINYDPAADYEAQRYRLIQVLEDHGFRYFRGGRVLPKGEVPLTPALGEQSAAPAVEPQKPSAIEDLLQTLIRGLPRAMHPLTHRRRGARSLSFESEYDIQDLLHSQLRPWVADIRPEEFTPSYAGSSTRMDFLLPKHKLVLEVKRVRDKAHAARVGDELIIDIEHYRRHPDCDRLWCVVYDPSHLIRNPAGLITDLQGHRSSTDGSVHVSVFVF